MCFATFEKGRRVIQITAAVPGSAGLRLGSEAEHVRRAQEPHGHHPSGDRARRVHLAHERPGGASGDAARPGHGERSRSQNTVIITLVGTAALHSNWWLYQCILRDFLRFAVH